MPVVLSDKTYYRTHEVIQRSGIPRTTLFRWIKKGKIKNAAFKDHRGWRLWTKTEIQKIKKFNETIIKR